MAKNDGGPAFPVAYQHRNPDGSESAQEWQGMALRDFFAAAALTGLFAARCETHDGETPILYAEAGINWNSPRFPESLAKLAYGMADAMLRGRAKQE